MRWHEAQGVRAGLWVGESGIWVILSKGDPRPAAVLLEGGFGFPGGCPSPQGLVALCGM